MKARQEAGQSSLLDDQPEIIPAARPYLAAWNDIQGQRHYGMSAGPLIRSELRSYISDEMRLAGEEFSMYLRVLTDLDHIQMEIWSKKTDA